jgi:hypothetical protein
MGEPTLIVRRARACRELFIECLSNEALMKDEWSENRLADFNLWVTGLSATTVGHASLDYRLRNHEDIRDMISDLLDELQDTLMECRQHGKC